MAEFEFLHGGPQRTLMPGALHGYANTSLTRSLSDDALLVE